MGAGQQVVDAALGPMGSRVVDAALGPMGTMIRDQALQASTEFGPQMFQRVVQDALPEVRAAYGVRGLGTSGGAALGEQEYIQRVRDDLAQAEIDNRLQALGIANQANLGALGTAATAQNGLLGAAASGASSAASQAIGAQNAAIGRGQLGLGAAQSIPGMLSGFQDVTGAPLGLMGQVAALQGLPLGLAGQGLDLYTQGLMLPMQYQQALYNFTRQPQLDLLSALSGTNVGQSRGWNFSLGGGGGKGGGGGGGGN
jgi:hypothetical protein